VAKVSYALDRLGWLQFQQLCAHVLQLDAGVPPGAWEGDADQCRFAVADDGLAAPLLDTPMRGRVLVQCAWLRPGAVAPVAMALETLASQHADQLRDLRSYVLMANGESVADQPSPSVGDLTVALIDTPILSARIDARPELRLAMPSLLGVRELDPLIPAAVAARSTLQRAEAERLAAAFVPTRAYARAVRTLSDHRFAVLAGPPEMGKTAIARMVALAKMTDGWEAHECTSPDEMLASLDPAAAQVFVADDAFGSTEYRPDSAEHWARAMERLLGVLDDRHWLIWTSRPAPLHAALGRLHQERGAERFPAPARVLVDASILDIEEKVLILFRHAKAAELPKAIRSGLTAWGPRIVENATFTPERIRRLVLRLGRGDLSVSQAADVELTTPTEAMASSFGALGAEHRDVLVALLDTPPGPVPERELVSALRRHHHGSLSRAPLDLVDRLADHFLRVSA
jgi:conflict system STAND superfamily ATPase